MANAALQWGYLTAIPQTISLCATCNDSSSEFQGLLRHNYNPRQSCNIEDFCGLSATKLEASSHSESLCEVWQLTDCETE